MNKIFSKYKRGDVWYIKFQNENGDGVQGSSVQKKSRPHVIVSCEENNNNAPVIQVVPIATMAYDHLPPHVYFNNSGRDQVVMCEQITTISVLDFQRKESKFMYSFNLDFMNKIDEALANQLGLKTRVADMKVLENLINKIAYNKEQELKKKYEDNIQIRVEKIAESLSKKFGISLNSQDMLNGLTYNDTDLKYVSKDTADELKETAKERTTPSTPSSSEKSFGELYIPLPWNSSKIVQSSPKSESVNSENKSNNSISKTVEKKKKNNWTEENMRKFLSDKQKMSLQEIADKYNVKKKSVYQLAWMFEKRLNGDHNENDKK